MHLPLLNTEFSQNSTAVLAHKYEVVKQTSSKTSFSARNREKQKKSTVAPFNTAKIPVNNAS
jgi:hypothetical protein